MKNVEKWIMVVLIIVAIGSIGGAVYLGIRYDKSNSENYGKNSSKNNINIDDSEDKIYAIYQGESVLIEEGMDLFGLGLIVDGIGETAVTINGQNSSICAYEEMCYVCPGRNGDFLECIMMDFSRDKNFNSSEDLEEDEEKVSVEEELLDMYLGPIRCEFEGKYTDELKTLVLIHNVETNKVADCKKIYGDDIKQLDDSGYEVIEWDNVLHGTICEEDSSFYDIETLKQKSIELFGKDIILRKSIADFYGGYYDYVEKEDAFVYLSCRCGDMCGNRFEIQSSKKGNNQFSINFLFNDDFNISKEYTIIFDIISDDKYIFNDLIEQ